MDDKKELERDATAETQESADAQPRKKDLSAFIKAAPKPGDPLPEETEEEKAQREADEKRLQEAIEKTFRLQERRNDALKWTITAYSPLLETVKQNLLYIENISKWAMQTRLERDEFYKSLEANAEAIAKATEGETPASIKALKGYMFDEWYNLHRNPDFRNQYKDISLLDLLKPEPDESGEMYIPIQLLVDRAKDLREKYRAEGLPDDELLFSNVDALEEAAETSVAKIQRIIASALPENLDFPLDKPNSNLWRLLEEAEGEQIAMEFDTTSDSMARKGKEAIIFYSLDFSAIDEPRSGVTITKRLTPFDKLVYMAAGALYNAGSNIFTIEQLYKMMGYSGRPSDKDRKKINESLTKMTSRLYIDSTKEVEINKNYPPFKYDSDLLPFERLEVIINNSPATAIHLFREPPLITFARERRQITTISRALLMPPVNKTTENLYIQDYLIERIAHMNNNKKIVRKMLYKTIYEKCNITTKKQKQRAPEKIKTFLDYYIQQGFIKSYKEGADGITIEF